MFGSDLCFGFACGLREVPLEVNWSRLAAQGWAAKPRRSSISYGACRAAKLRSSIRSWWLQTLSPSLEAALRQSPRRASPVELAREGPGLREGSPREGSPVDTRTSGGSLRRSEFFPTSYQTTAAGEETLHSGSAAAVVTSAVTNLQRYTAQVARWDRASTLDSCRDPLPSGRAAMVGLCRSSAPWSP